MPIFPLIHIVWYLLFNNANDEKKKIKKILKDLVIQQNKNMFKEEMTL